MKLPSEFAPSERSSDKEIEISQKIVASIENLSEIFNAMTSIAAIIDKNRQVVFANESFIKDLGFTSLDEIIGKRPGEVVGCINHDTGPGGCGTSTACKYCGAVRTILESQQQALKVENEARITTSNGSFTRSWDLKVTCSPITLSGVLFYVFTIEDISNDKRRQNLERIFFHDILNLAGALNGLMTILKASPYPLSMREIVFRSEETSRVLIEEILTHRQLRSAEDGDLPYQPEELNTFEVLKAAVSKMQYHTVTAGKKIEIDQKTAVTIFDSDRNLIERVLLNLLKNAIEATPANGTVTCGSKASGNTISFWVRNDGVLSEEVQKQIFQRSFSTKGKGRGFGTYSVKLLTENYLKGSVSFTSSPKEGTVFTVILNTR